MVEYSVVEKAALMDATTGVQWVAPKAMMRVDVMEHMTVEWSAGELVASKGVLKADR